MAVKARCEITLSAVVDVKAVYRYYKLQSSTLSKPGKPTTRPPSGWNDAEPTYTTGSTNSLYVVELNVFSDDTYAYSEVSLSSSYEAAKAAYNKAVAAGNIAQDAKETVDNLEIGGTQILRGTNTVFALTSSGAWQSGLWRSASGGSGTRSGIAIRDAPNANIKRGWELTSANSGNVGIAQDAVPITNGKTYTMSCYAKGTGTLRLQYGKSPYPEKTYVLSNVTAWTRYSFTFTIGKQSDGSTGGSTNIYFGIAQGNNTTVQICGLKLEQGNKPTDWTPAPEDTQSEIDSANVIIQSHTEKLSTHDSKISANETQIDLRVKKSDFEAYAVTVNSELSSARSRLSTTESGIKTLQGQVALKVEQTDIEEAVQNLQIGGRNLILNSDFGKQFNKWGNGGNAVLSYGTDNMYGTYAAFKCSSAGDASKNRIYQVAFDGGANHVAGKTYTLSFYAKASASTGIHAGWAGKLKSFSVSTEWKRYITTYTPTATGSLTFYVDEANITLYLTRVMLEESTKASSWVFAQGDIEESIASVDGKLASYSTTAQMNTAITAAKDSITSAVSQTYAKKSELTTANNKISSLETWKAEASQKITKDGIVATVGNHYAYQTDFDTALNRITTVETKATQTANKFNWIVKTGTSATDFTLTDRVATLVADAINLKGLVTFSGLDAATQSKITTAESWIVTNGANMVNLRNMILKWTNNAVSASTYIQGGWIATNTITANKLAIADFTNYAQLNDYTYGSYGFIRTADANGSIFTESTLKRDTAISEYQTCNGGEKLLIKGQISSSAKGASTNGGTDSVYRATRIGVYCYDGSKTVVSGGWLYSKGPTGTAEAPWTDVQAVITIPDATRYFKIFVQISGWAPFSGTVKVRNIEVIKMASGELVVDGAITTAKIQSGAITTDKLAANAVTAEKINVNDLFAQDITATGTIKGATLIGATGEFTGKITSNSGKIAGFWINDYQIGSDNAGMLDEGQFWIRKEGSDCVYTSQYEERCIWFMKSDSEIGWGSYSSTEGKGIKVGIEGIDWHAGIGANFAVNVDRVEFWKNNKELFKVDEDGFFVGGEKLEKKYSAIGHSHSYAGSPAVGGAANLLYMPRLSSSGDSANVLPGSYCIQAREYGNTCANTPSAHWYHILTGQGADNNYNTQIALGMTTENLYYRYRNNGIWGNWRNILHSGNYNNYAPTKTGGGASGTWGISISGQAAKARQLCANDGKQTFGTTESLSARISTADGLKTADFTLGESGSTHRWKQIYATATTISTSDRNQKRDIHELSDKYEQLFLKLIPVSFLYISGESGRTHIGFVSQDIEKAMEEVGLSSLDFAGFCKDIETDTIINEEGREIDVPRFDKNGNQVYIYSLRYEEFIALNTHMLQKLYKRVSALERECVS